MKPPIIRLKDIGFHALTQRECTDHILAKLALRQGGWVITPNIDILRRATKDAAFRGLVNEADLVVADGMPLVWASKIAHTPLPERVAGSSLMVDLTAQAAAQGRSIYLLGGDAGTAEAAARSLTERHPTLRIAGTSSPWISTLTTDCLDNIRRSLVAARPDIVFVGLGSPKQELLISALKDSLPATWWLGIGITFSFICGRVQRAPVWMQNSGIEWLHRLVQEPRRLAHRYLVHGIPFAIELFASACCQRFFLKKASSNYER